MHVLELEHLPQQRLGGHPGDRAHLQGTAMQTAGDDLDEPPQQGAHQVRRQRIGDRLAAANEHIGQQRQPQRMAMGQLDQLIVTDRVDATGVQVRAAVLGLRLRSDTTRNSSRQAGSARQAEPGADRPATTVRAVAGRRGSRRVRTQSSNGASRS